MLVVVIIVGLLYALPNLYGEDPAVQITGARGVAASEQTLIQVQKTLQEEKITAKSVALEEGAILARFDTTDTQLRAREALMGVLGDKYVVALNLAPATPRWLAALNAEPMKLGLDLRGGVHFLMEVDMDTALGKLQEQNIDSLRSDLRDKGIPYTTVRKEDNYGMSITFRDSAARDQAVTYLSQRHRDLVITSQGSNQLRAVMTDARLSEAREYAVQQNINILRNRVNQLGVAEPLVQRQGADRIVVELPGIQDTARAKEILGATATLEFRLVNANVDQAAAASGHVPGDSLRGLGAGVLGQVLGPATGGLEVPAGPLVGDFLRGIPAAPDAGHVGHPVSGVLRVEAGQAAGGPAGGAALQVPSSAPSCSAGKWTDLRIPTVSYV